MLLTPALGGAEERFGFKYPHLLQRERYLSTQPGENEGQEARAGDFGNDVLGAQRWSHPFLRGPQVPLGEECILHLTLSPAHSTATCRARLKEVEDDIL